MIKEKRKKDGIKLKIKRRKQWNKEIKKDGRKKRHGK